MIHNVPRDEIRMIGGEVIVTDPIKEELWDDVLPDLRDFARRMNKVLGEVSDGYIVVRKYDRLDSVIASTPVLVILHNIGTVASKVVQIEADESITFPVSVD